MSQEPVSEVKTVSLCPRCNQELPWPYIPLTQLENRFLKAIRFGAFSTQKELFRCVDPGAIHRDAALRSTLRSLNERLQEVNLKIVSRPYHLVQTGLISK